jgi:hypothetical protein
MTDLETAFADPDPSARLKAVMMAGIHPVASDLEALVARCAVEPDFQVREMLTWALLRLPADLVVGRVIAELERPEPQARSQALHTLSKLHDRSAWPAVAARLDDADPTVVRTAWYTAVTLVPDTERGWLAGKLAAQLGRGSYETRLSLSRALVGLGENAIMPVLASATSQPDEAIQKHAQATEQLLRDPDSGFALDRETAHHEVALGRTRSAVG